MGIVIVRRKNYASCKNLFWYSKYTIYLKKKIVFRLADKEKDLKLHKYYATVIALTSNYYVQTKMKLNLQTMHHIF